MYTFRAVKMLPCLLNPRDFRASGCCFTSLAKKNTRWCFNKASSTSASFSTTERIIPSFKFSQLAQSSQPTLKRQNFIWRLNSHRINPRNFSARGNFAEHSKYFMIPLFSDNRPEQQWMLGAADEVCTKAILKSLFVCEGCGKVLNSFLVFQFWGNKFLLLL